MSFQRADDDLLKLVATTLKKHHKALADAGVTVQVLMKDELKHQGYPAYASVKRVSLKDRVLGHSDVEIVIDASRWALLSPAQRIAIVDHELTHVDLKIGKGGKTEIDDAGRPKITLRPHDHQFGWFDEVAERHGKDSIEVEQAQQFFDARGQSYLTLAVASTREA